MRLAVIGLGYVGLPLARLACSAGLSVTGLDTCSQVVANLGAGKSHVDDVRDSDVIEMLSSGFVATEDPSTLPDADVIVICVPTPLTAAGYPNVDSVIGAAEVIAGSLRRGQLVILESTSYPGTTEEVVLPILKRSGLEVGRDFACAFSPERIDPGNPAFNLRNTPKVVGGVTEECSRQAKEFYEMLVDEVVLAKGTREAEMAKLLENTYRHVNIALVNELAQFCALLGIDLWDAINCASTKPFGFQPFYPGPGVGGHCIPIDPKYLSHSIKANLGSSFRFVELAEEINKGMPGYVVRRIQELLNDMEKPLRGSSILLLGVTYKANISDQRESPALAIGAELLMNGALVSYHDPFVSTWLLPTARLRSLETSELDRLHGFDVIVLLQGHDCYKNLGIPPFPTRVLDTRGILSASNVFRI